MFFKNEFLKKHFKNLKMRTAHSRFLNKQPVGKRDEFDRVVTSVWSLDKNTNILTYGAVVYFKNGPNDHWGKRRHYLKAVERFHKNPVRVSLQYTGFGNLSSMANLSMDWYIATNLIFKFGTYDKTGVVPPVGFHGTSTIYDDFNEAYCKLSHRYEDSSDEEDSDDEDDKEEQSKLSSNDCHSAFYMLAGFVFSSLSTFIYLRFIGL
jgi:hypothetical protein